MEDPRSADKTHRDDTMRRAEDVLEELPGLAGDVARVGDSRKKPEEDAALASFEEVMDVLENKVH